MILCVGLEMDHLYKDEIDRESLSSLADSIGLMLNFLDCSIPFVGSLSICLGKSFINI